MSDLILYSEQAKRFKRKYEPELYKPYEVVLDETPLGNCEETSTHFIIRLRSTLADESKPAHDSNFCHELYHAVQVSKGFPSYTTQNDIPDYFRVFLSTLRSVLLDMDVNDILAKEGIDCFHSFNDRINFMWEQCGNGLKEVQNRYDENTFALKLLLFYSHTPHKKSKQVKRNMERLNPYIARCVKDLEGIAGIYGYNTPDRAFCTLGHFLTHFDLWDGAGILFDGKVFSSQDAFNQQCAAICQ